MTVANWLRSLFESSEEDHDEEEIRPTVVEYHREEEEYEYTFNTTLERNVALIHFRETGSLLVEYDYIEDTDDEKRYNVVNGVYQYNGRRYSHPEPGEEDNWFRIDYSDNITVVKDDAVAHVERLGSFDIDVYVDATMTRWNQVVDNPEDIPVCADDGSPVHGLLITGDGTPLSNAIGRIGKDGDGGFETKTHIAVDEIHDDTFELIPQGSVADVLDESLVSGTQSLRTATADGTVMLPENESSVGEDIEAVRALPSGDE